MVRIGRRRWIGSGFMLAVVAVVGVNDALHQSVAYNILTPELHAPYSFYSLEHTHGLHQARHCGAREVNLRGVARDNHLGVHT